MMKTSALEIDVPLQLTKKQENMVMMHSVWTMLNVLDHELDTFGALLQDFKLLKPTKEYISIIRTHLDSEALTYEHLEEIDELFHLLKENLAMAIDGLPQVMKIPEARTDIANLMAVMEHFKKTANAYINRKKNPFEWNKIAIADIETEVKDFFDVVSKNCRNRFKVVYGKENQTSNDYLIDMVFPASSVTMPVIFRDVIIDLLANARKFSKQGTTIQFLLENKNKHLHMSVEDQGIGIKSDQLEKVVNFFEEEENPLKVSKIGIGLGLTKAYFITKHLHGKFEISTQIGVGTKIDICIPLPKH